MANKSHFNSGHFAMNKLNKDGLRHSAAVEARHIARSCHGIYIRDAVEFLRKLPDSSIQLILNREYGKPVR